uniref:oligopeptide/dipeptide ABC transporter ATP-binding protein n=1 Tax=Agathobacter sp. TaxID=2021311 RepID=UPI0040577384
MKKKLSVHHLVVSFLTPAGKVQAVRDISFDLYEGETLAVVGESGSGKSVASKAILGILAGNAIVEGGSVIYDGMDLLKITEEEFYHIRGDKIAMIFQDPLSSLNPIMRVGQQLTEAMLLKGKSRRKSCRKLFNHTLVLLTKEIEAAWGNASKPANPKEMTSGFRKFVLQYSKLEQAYNAAHEAAEEMLDEIKDVLLCIEKNSFDGETDVIKKVEHLARMASNEYVIRAEDFNSIKKLLKELKSASKEENRSKTYQKTTSVFIKLQAIMERVLRSDVPDFFSMGYCLTFSKEPLPDMPIHKLNGYMTRCMEEQFMNNFKFYVAKALEHSAERHNALKAEAVKVIEANRHIFIGENLNKKACQDAAQRMIQAVEASIDKLEIHKDGVAYTFASGIKSAINTYFDGIPKNHKVKELYKKQRKEAANFGTAKETMTAQIDRLLSHYKELPESRRQRNFWAEAEELIGFFKENASGAVYHVTKEMAKRKAIKLMEEVGISEAGKRYYQYPFEFSGGMCQRIVIAIALAANPDILICDEPTTALDVTIQAQILELINKLKRERNLSIIFITHDLGVVANMADRIAVMYAGKIAEIGTREEIFYAPAHPYTWALLSAMPDFGTKGKLESIPGTPPNMICPPVGDAFAERSSYAMQIDFEMQPPEFKISDTHFASTWLLHPEAPKVQPPKAVLNRIERMKENRGTSYDEQWKKGQS